MKLHYLLGAVALFSGVASGVANAGPQTIGLTGAKPDFDKVEIASPHVYDYTFASAPTDWRVQSGLWEMTNRWACSPGWSWFGGRSDETAAVWNKRKFSGDMSVQFYFAFKMGLAGTPAWNYHPSDMGITIGGDGQKLSSGYSFVVGADDNARSVLMHEGQVVAENRTAEALLPSFTDGNPDSGHREYEQLHRRWWYVRVDKIGNRVSCFLDNKLLFSYTDPTPIDAGQIALWTYNNGIMLSRVQVYYENEVRAPFMRRAAASTKQQAASARAASAKAASRTVKPAPKSVQTAPKAAASTKIARLP